MSLARKHVVRAALLCALAVAVAPVAAHGAVARTSVTAPCWKLLLNDWYDGTINKTYPIPCYQQAINHLPADLRIYGSARDDILAARAAVISGKPTPPEHNGTTTGASTAGASTAGASTAGASTTTTTTEVVTKHGTTSTTTTVLVVPVQTTPPKKSTPLLDRLNPGNPDSFPLPLLILGALAILLVVAGGAGMLWQRSHPRDDDASAA
jgi:hypothetical protein